MTLTKSGEGTQGELRLVSVQDASQEFLLGLCMVFGCDRFVHLVMFGYESFDVPRNRLRVVSKLLDCIEEPFCGQTHNSRSPGKNTMFVEGLFVFIKELVAFSAYTVELKT